MMGFEWLPNPVRNHFIAFLGELAGTFLFLFFGFSAAQVANAGAAAAAGSDPAAPLVSTLLYIAFAFGFSLAVNAWVFFRISGGMFNPAVRGCGLDICTHDVLTALPMSHWDCTSLALLDG
jgi:aquaporin rerated protein, other eukaryote